MFSYRTFFQQLLLQATSLGIVGPTYGGDGSPGPPTGRQGKTGESVVTTSHGKYYEDASRGYHFAASDNGTGITVTTSLSTTAIISLHNPANSKVRVALSRLWLAYFSGTMPSGAFYHCLLGPGITLPSSGTAPTVYCTDAGNISGPSAQGVFRHAPTVAAPTSSNALILPAASSFAELATTANPFQLVVVDFDGEFVLEPGAQYQLQGVFGAAGTTPKVSAGLSWKEMLMSGTQG